MEAPKATLHEPLKFFHWMFIENNFDYYKAGFFYNYECEDWHYSFYKIDREKEIITHDSIYDDFNNQVINRVCFGDELKNKLNLEAKNAKDLIKSAIADIIYQGNPPLPFTQLQTNIINIIQEKSQAYTYKYPFIATIINQIKEHIESQLNLVGGKASPTQSNSRAFVYKGNTPALNKMKEYLEEKNLINMADDFIKIFTGKSFEKKINWISYNNAFHYFIDKLSECESIDFNRDEKWKIAVRCFTIKDEPIDNNDIKSNNKPPAQKTKDIIEKAIKNLNW
jgi:hypothetical protein